MKRKSKAAPIEFDVAEFLRPTDTDLKSAIHSLLGTTLETGLPKIEAAPNLGGGINLVPDVASPPTLEPPLKIRAHSNLVAGINLPPPPKLLKQRSFAIREARSASDGHSRAEEQVYQTLLQQGEIQADASRLIQIGYLALARLVGLSESNARINLRSLERKLAVEEFATYVCEQSQGRTWRIFSPAQILERRSIAGLRFYMKRTLAVVFVDPRTGQRLLD